MTTSDQLQALVQKWAVTSEEYRSEARRLESLDRSRHAVSIAMLEASAQAFDKCGIEIRKIDSLSHPYNSVGQ